MPNSDWSKVKRIFQEAVELDSAARAGFVTDACGADTALRAEIDSLLNSYASAETFLETPVIHVPGALEEFSELMKAGQKIGNYVLIRTLGHGGMGTVFLAERDDVNQQVAIKVLPRLLLSPARRKRFVSEERALARLKHDFIAQLYDVGVLDDGTPWFAMEYVNGVAITDYCKERPIDECIELFRLVCEAVLYAHSQLTVHRDLKPSNILVRSTERGATPKLLDFGIAKQLDIAAEAGDSGLTLTLMTMAYAAPEQIAGTVSFKIDVYSLGVILYELIAGQPPFDFENQSPAAIEQVKTNTDPRNPSEVSKQNSSRQPRAGSWADVDKLCLTAMHKDAAQRYGSVEALIRDVEHYLASEPLEARGDSLVYKVRKFTQRHRAGIAVTAAILTVAIAWAIFFTVRLTTARNGALAAAARTQRVQDFLSDLLSGGDREAGPAADLKVVNLIEQGVRQAQQFDREPEIQAELYYTLGNSYCHLGLFEQAEPLLVSSLERRRTLFNADDPRVIESLVSLGLLRMEQSRLEESEKFIREGLEKTKRAHPDNEKLYATVVTALGRVLTTRGDYKQAISVVEDAVKRNDKGVPTAELVKLLTQLANARFYAGNYEISETLNQRILALSRQLFGNNHVFVADALINLATIQSSWGHHKEAEELNREALSISESWYGKDHPELASNLIHLAQEITQQGRYDESEKFLIRALDIDRRVYPQGHPRTAFALNELGALALRRDKLDEAEKWFSEAAELNRKNYGEEHFRTITAMSNLASVYAGKKDYVRAEKTMREVVARFEKIAADHLNTGISRLKLGRIFFLEHQYQQAETEALAGLEIVRKQKNSNAIRIREACQLLIEIYEARKDHRNATKFRELLSQYAAQS